jgi:hypothetical protein
LRREVVEPAVEVEVVHALVEVVFVDVPAVCVNSSSSSMSLSARGLEQMMGYVAGHTNHARSCPCKTK